MGINEITCAYDSEVEVGQWRDEGGSGGGVAKGGKRRTEGTRSVYVTLVDGNDPVQSICSHAGTRVFKTKAGS